MTEFARGGLILTGDPTPIYTETMRVLTRWDGYVLPASTLRSLGNPGLGFLASLNAVAPGQQ